MLQSPPCRAKGRRDEVTKAELEDLNAFMARLETDDEYRHKTSTWEYFADHPHLILPLGQPAMESLTPQRR